MKGKPKMTIPNTMAKPIHISLVTAVTLAARPAVHRQCRAPRVLAAGPYRCSRGTTCVTDMEASGRDIRVVEP